MMGASVPGVDETSGTDGVERLAPWTKHNLAMCSQPGYWVHFQQAVSRWPVSVATRTPPTGLAGTSVTARRSLAAQYHITKARCSVKMPASVRADPVLHTSQSHISHRRPSTS